MKEDDDDDEEEEEEEEEGKEEEEEEKKEEEKKEEEEEEEKKKKEEEGKEEKKMMYYTSLPSSQPYRSTMRYFHSTSSPAIKHHCSVSRRIVQRLKLTADFYSAREFYRYSAAVAAAVHSILYIHRISCLLLLCVVTVLFCHALYVRSFKWRQTK